ncbi:hypothetical protein LRAMOSA10924 [Lichtheimia ramosa]|uniref:Uncharacterized protein n=1 Tax=Lichtheimia ramosa TaxID=688394 RepID=A0A077WQZ0_9FUNG|nr:hypothetical protein LRAMOSA10924 [Lichtheimia ramosa]
MKLIGLFGVLLAISPVFAAEQPGVCAGKVPAKTLDKCNKEPCTFIYEEYAVKRFTMKKYLPCTYTDAETNCAPYSKKDTLNECLSHGCAYTETSYKNGRLPSE